MWLSYGRPRKKDNRRRVRRCSPVLSCDQGNRCPVMTDRDLIRAVLDGVPEAGDELVVRFTRFVYAILVRSFRFKSEVADDLYQEVFLRLMQDDYRRLALWRGDGDFADYLAPIVRNVARSHLRGSERDPVRIGNHGEDFDERVGFEPGPEEQAVVVEQRRLVERAVEQLGPRERELYRLRFVDDRKHKEIAAALDLTVSHVGVSLLRLERRLALAVGKMAEKGAHSRQGNAGVRSGGSGASRE